MIKDLLVKGYSGNAISRIIGRGKNTVIVELARFKGRTYEPELAQKEARERVKKRKIDVSKTLKDKGGLSNPYKSLVNRIESLEMQVEILLDIIKDRSK